MSENKHYGRQIFLSLFLTVFLLLGIIYLASRYLLPLYDVNEEQIYGILVKLFPLLIGLVMIEIGVLIARRRDEEYADQVDKLPPNAYDKPFYTLPHDDPSHLHSDDLVYSQQSVQQVKPTIQKEVEIEHVEESDIQPIQPLIFEEQPKPVAPVLAQVQEEESTVYKTDFESILCTELDNSIDMDYDLTLVLIEVTHGPAPLIANKLLMQSGELAYSFTLEDGMIAMVLPFYNGEEARTFTLSIIESCKKEFSGSELQIGFASRNGRMIDSKQLLHEAQVACSVRQED